MTGSPLHDICLLSLDTGLRANEIFSLEWMDVNFKTKTLSIRDPKGIINRYANMTNKVYEMLIQRKKYGFYIFLCFHKYKRRKDKKRFQTNLTGWLQNLALMITLQTYGIKLYSIL